MPNVGHLPTSLELLDEIASTGRKPASISDYVFAVNPMEFQEDNAWLVFYQPTHDGVGRIEYNVQPYQIILRGNTGNAGVHAMEGAGTIDPATGSYREVAASMRVFRPLFGGKSGPFLFSFPWFGFFARKIFVDHFTRSATATDSPFLHSYVITMTQLPIVSETATPVTKALTLAQLYHTSHGGGGPS